MFDNARIDKELALAMFRRVRISAAIGIVGVGIMAYPYLVGKDSQACLAWVAAMALILLLRVAHAAVALRAIAGQERVVLHVDFEALLCLGLGIGWGCTLYIFDSGNMAPLFFMRIVVLAAVIAFVMPSTTHFLRVFVAYLLPIIILALAFIASHGYVDPATPYLLAVGFYGLMVIGTAIGSNRTYRQAMADHLGVVALTEKLSVALEREKILHATMQELVRTDELTKIFNRRGILERLDEEILKCQRYVAPLAALMIDIDHFKKINDTFGHPGGDVAICSVVQILQETLRRTDFIGRVGGEEFLVILPMLDKEGATLTAERLRRAVDDGHVMIGGKRLRMSISVGLGLYHDGDRADALLARADKAVYAAKENGRNRVEIQE